MVGHRFLHKNIKIRYLHGYYAITEILKITSQLIGQVSQLSKHGLEFQQ